MQKKFPSKEIYGLDDNFLSSANYLVLKKFHSNNIISKWFSERYKNYFRNGWNYELKNTYCTYEICLTNEKQQNKYFR